MIQSVILIKQIALKHKARAQFESRARFIFLIKLQVFRHDIAALAIRQNDARPLVARNP